MSKRTILEDINYRNYSNYRKTCSLSGLCGLLLAAGFFFAGCQSDPIEPADDSRLTTMELMTATQSFLDVTPWTTRADGDDYQFTFGEGYTGHLPTGYVPYESLYPTTTPNNNNIGVFMTPEKTTPSGNFIYQGVDAGVNIWKSNIVVEKDKSYYIYGFMPRQFAHRAVIFPLPGVNTSGEDKGFKDGAVIRIEEFEALTPADVSVIVGLRWATDEEKISGTKNYDVPLGNFKYTGRDEGKNRLFVLLKHIYAGLHFAATIDPEYNALRSIRVTKVELIAQNITERINLNVTLTANSTGADPLTEVQYEGIGVPAATSTIQLFPFEDSEEDIEIQETTPASFLGCFVPSSCESFIIRCTYDVYDRDTSVNPKGNLIRKGCVAENQINRHIIPSFPTLAAGQNFTINLRIQPTFLYVLSEPDLDNPTIVVN